MYLNYHYCYDVSTVDFEQVNASWDRMRDISLFNRLGRVV